MKNLRALLGIALVVCLAVALPACNQNDPKNFKVGFVYAGLADDGGSTTAQDVGRRKLEEALGVTTFTAENVPEGDGCRAQIEELIKKGCKVIFAASSGYSEVCVEMAQKNPAVVFEVFEGRSVNGNNLGSYRGRLYQAGYMAGIAAGYASKKETIGLIAPFPTPETIGYINAFALGTQYVNHEAVVNVSWTLQRYDPQTERLAAGQLLEGGCDVLAQLVQTAEPVSAAEAADAFSIGCYQPMPAAAPNGYLASPVYVWGDYFVSVVKAVMEGNHTPQAYWGGLETGVVALDGFGPSVDDKTKNMIQAVADEIKMGARNVFAGPLIDQNGTERVAEGAVLTDDELLAMNWFVRGVNGTAE